MTTQVVRLTVAQAIIRYLCAQYTEIDGEKLPLFAGVFAIFGHGNVTCLGEALAEVQDKMPTWRGQNEQSMALAGVAYAKAKLRRQIMVATSSVGPGATNMITAAGVAHANRLPILIMSGDIFANRRPDPVLQQVEHFSQPSISVNDAFKPVTRYWDRITHPEQIISSLPQAVATMLDPADCGPAFIGLCQDIQEIAFDYPAAFFAERTHIIPRPRPDQACLSAAIERIKLAKKPLIISGGGVRYSQAAEILGNFATARGIPICETIAGKGAFTHDHPAHIGPIGVIGSSSANNIAGEADLILAVGTRLQDFTTGSWTIFSHDCDFISINAARFDAHKHQALAVVGDASETLKELDGGLGDWAVDGAWMKQAKGEFANWNAILDRAQAEDNSTPPSYSQIIGVVNRMAKPNDLVLSAAGGLPGELAKGWRVKDPNSFDCEFGFSCMGYEVAGGWGAAMANPDRDVFVMVGDGSYLMMNSDVYSTVLTGHKVIFIICDNGGYAVINRLQNFKGNVSFNNLIKDSRVKEPFSVDFAAHAQSMGALARKAESLADLAASIEWARKADRSCVISIASDAHSWVEGDAAWDVGVPEISKRAQIVEARKSHEEIRRRQRIGV